MANRRSGSPTPEREIRADFVIGADGSRSQCRSRIPEAHRKRYFHEYPFDCFGILAEAPGDRMS